MAAVSAEKRFSIAAGFPAYFTGEPCKNGHVAWRDIANSSCRKCLSDATRRYQLRNPAKVKAWTDLARKKYEERNKEKVAAAKSAWKARNPDAVIAGAKDYYAKHKEQSRELRKRWRQEKPWMHAEGQRRRNIGQKKATPAWANLVSIRAIYREAARLTRETGVAHHVDHIVPLRGKQVCGLHVETNLRILTATENIRKGARHRDG
jgi:5-methylcytosine-specific restriction endonuclease McrA